MAESCPFPLGERHSPTSACCKAASLPLPPEGQLWGSPLYKWSAHKAQRYDWWCQRIGRAMQLYDQTRIDHFRGFAGGRAGPVGGWVGKWVSLSKARNEWVFPAT